MPNGIHAFVGSVGLAGMHGSLWSVEGGNYLVAEKLKELSNARSISRRVNHIYKLMFSTTHPRKILNIVSSTLLFYIFCFSRYNL